MQQATTAADMKRLMAQFPAEEVQAAWAALDPAQRGALLLIRFFPGSTILPDDDDTSL